MLLILLVTSSVSLGMYHPETGRFIQQDPIGVRDRICIIDFQDTGKPIFPRQHNDRGQYRDGMNLFQYVKSDPIRLSDPVGTSLKLQILGPRYFKEVFKGCGGYSYPINWSLNYIDDATGKRQGRFSRFRGDGWVVQKITMSYLLFNCVDNTIEKYWSKEYFEKWRVYHGFFTRPMLNYGPGAPALQRYQDHFTLPNARDCTRGYRGIIGSAAFIPDVSEEGWDYPNSDAGYPNPYHHGEAGNLPTSNNAPPNWPGWFSRVWHGLHVFWDCCQCQKEKPIRHSVAIRWHYP